MVAAFTDRQAATAIMAVTVSVPDPSHSTTVRPINVGLFIVPSLSALSWLHGHHPTHPPRYGYHHIARCDLCCRFVPLDLGALARRLGLEVTVPEVRRRLRCTWCGLKRSSVQMANQAATLRNV